MVILVWCLFKKTIIFFTGKVAGLTIAVVILTIALLGLVVVFLICRKRLMREYYASVWENHWRNAQLYVIKNDVILKWPCVKKQENWLLNIWHKGRWKGNITAVISSRGHTNHCNKTVWSGIRGCACIWVFGWCFREQKWPLCFAKCTDYINHFISGI